MSKQLVIAFFGDEAAADTAVDALKQWDKASQEIKLGGIGVLVKDDTGKVKTHKLGSRRTVLGAVLLGLAAVMTGGASLWAGLVVGGLGGSFLRKGPGVSKEALAAIDAKLNSGAAAVAVMANPDEAAAVGAKLAELGGMPEAHVISDGEIAQATSDAVVAPAPAASGAAAIAAATAAGPEMGAQVQAAAQAFFYGYPLVYSLHEIAGFVTGGGKFPMQAPYNVFGHARDLAGPEMKFVSPNNDTLYTIAMCDVRQGPLVLHVPDSGNRYYVLQFVDAWSNNFAYIGQRATGTAEGRYLLAAQDYAGPAPDGMTMIHPPTGVFAIVGRVAVDGEADLPAAHALQDQFTLTPLNPAATPVGVPSPDPRVGEDLEWWERLRVALAAFPPPAADAPYLAACAKLGLTAAESPYVNPDPELAKLLVAGQKAGQDKIEEMMKAVHASPTGWQSAMHMFDYNLDYFGVGTIDAPEWKIADRTTAYAARAVVARAGLWGNHGYEADYEIVWVDADKQPLTSEHSYELHLAAPPPVDAFWSLTMYDVPEFYLVANAIKRYSIGDRTPGLKYGADGSLTIYLQKGSPGPDRESNWLPTPQAGPFRPIMRMYAPRQQILDGSYALPAIKRVG